MVYGLWDLIFLFWLLNPLSGTACGMVRLSGSFYSLAVINIIPVFACFALVYDTVASHPKISKEEAEYISAGKMGEIHPSSNSVTSYKFLSKSIFWLTSIVYALNLASFWGILSWLPTYLITSHGFSWAKGGILSAVPYFVNILFLIIFTPLMDKYNSRAPFTTAGCVLLTVSMLLVTIAVNPLMALAAISLGFGCITMANCSLVPHFTKWNGFQRGRCSCRLLYRNCIRFFVCVPLYNGSHI